MGIVIKSANRTITSPEIIPLLSKYGLLHRLAYEDIIEQAIASIKCTKQELVAAAKIWQPQIESQKQYLSSEEVLAFTIRNIKIEKFKQIMWGKHLSAYFISRKKQLDRVVYSCVQTQNKALAWELYFRLIEGEQTLSELAKESTPERPIAVELGIEPVELGSLTPAVIEQLTTLEANSFTVPLAVKESFVIFYLEKHIPAQCDRQTSIRLLNELFDRWMQQQLKEHQYHLEEN